MGFPLPPIPLTRNAFILSETRVFHYFTQIRNIRSEMYMNQGDGTKIHDKRPFSSGGGVQ